MSKILILDIETAPNIAYVWGAWKQNVGSNQWVQKSHIMSFAAKWLGDDPSETIYVESRKSDDKLLVTAMFELLDEADMVVAHNGKRFDLPRIIGRGLVHGLTPPSPYKIIDTLLVARKEFGFVSNKLEDLCKELGLSEKLTGQRKFKGFDLWLECLRNNDEAWEEMRVYNIQDIISLEELYLRMRPYMRLHPNVNKDAGCKCTKCGSGNMQKRGLYFTASGLAYQRYRCNDCGGWNKDRYQVKDREASSARNAI